MSNLTVIAGPNGSGKSTLTRGVNLVGRECLLDPDVIARDLNSATPSLAAVAAGREVLKRTAEYFGRRASFAVETTLAGQGRVDLIREAKLRGYVVELVFIALDSPERCITRIRNRASLGGRSVPDADVHRRYARSVANAAEAMRLADRAKFFDNSGNAARLVLAAKAGVVTWRAEPLPGWFKL